MNSFGTRWLLVLWRTDRALGSLFLDVGSRLGLLRENWTSGFYVCQLTFDDATRVLVFFLLKVLKKLRGKQRFQVNSARFHLKVPENYNRTTSCNVLTQNGLLSGYMRVSSIGVFPKSPTWSLLLPFLNASVASRGRRKLNQDETCETQNSRSLYSDEWWPFRTIFRIRLYLHFTSTLSTK